MSKQKNLLLFLTDDHGAWASGTYGNSELETPTLDKLAKDGVRFENAFTPTPVCSPARACLLTGQTPSQVGIHDWLQEAEAEIGQRDWLGQTKTLFDYFQAAGYTTGLSGKWHLGQSDRPPRGADFHFGLPGWQGVHNHEYQYVKNGRPLISRRNKSALITDHAIQFLEEAPADKPFFLNVGYVATHSPYHKESHSRFVTGLYADATFADLPPYAPHPWVNNEGFPFDAPTEADLRDHYIGYYAAVTEIDRQIERILTALENLGQLEDTLVVYTSDHGLTLGHHGFWGKGNSTRPLNMYETSLRVPLIWSGAGLPSGSAPNQAVTHYDTFQTILDLVGISPQAAQPFPGRSYRSFLLDQTAQESWDNAVYGEYGDLRMIRTERWKLVHRYPDGPHDLYDLINDAGETANKIDNPAYRPLVADLRQRLDRFYAQYERNSVSGLRVKALPRHNAYEAWRDGLREKAGYQLGKSLVEVREGNPADVPALVEFGLEVGRESYIRTGFLPADYVNGPQRAYWRADYIESVIQNDQSLLLVVLDGDQLIGMTEVELLSETEAVMWKLYFLPAYQRQGLGKRLLEEIKGRLPPSVEILKTEYYDSNRPAARFYAAQGFTFLERKAEPFGDTRIPYTFVRLILHPD